MRRSKLQRENPLMKVVKLGVFPDDIITVMVLGEIFRYLKISKLYRKNKKGKRCNGENGGVNNER